MLLKILPLLSEWEKGQKPISAAVWRRGSVRWGISSLRKGEVGKFLSVDSVENKDYYVNSSKYPGQVFS